MNNESPAVIDDQSSKSKEIWIYVNTREEMVIKKKLSFDDVIAIAFGTPDHATSAYTVTYSKGENQKPKGSLVQGEEVTVKNGMIFDVIRTDKS